MSEVFTRWQLVNLLVLVEGRDKYVDLEGPSQLVTSV